MRRRPAILPRLAFPAVLAWAGISFSQPLQWSQIHFPGQAPVTAAVSAYGVSLAASSKGLVRSRDGGITWQTLAGTWAQSNLHFFAAVDSVFFAVGQTGVWRSDDFGNAWSETEVGPGRLLHIGPYNGLICGRFDKDQVLCSSDRGKTWAPLIGAAQGESLGPLLAAGSSLFAGGYAGLLVSRDRGKTFTRVPGLPEESSVTVLKRDSSRIYAGFASEGLFVSTNGGQSWTALNRGLRQKVGGIPVSALDAQGDRLYLAMAGAMPGGVYVSENGGRDWVRRNAGLPGFPAGDSGTDSSFQVGSIQLHRSLLFAATQSGVYRSENDGRLWTPVNSLPPHFRSEWVYTSLNTMGSVLYACNFSAEDGNPTYRSDDGGKTWEMAPESLRDLRSLFHADGLNYAVTDRGLFRSLGGDGWDRIPGPRGTLGPQAVAISGNMLFYSTPSERGEFFVSENLGQTWLGDDAGFLQAVLGNKTFRVDGRALQRWDSGTGSWQASRIFDDSIRSLEPQGRRLFAVAGAKIHVSSDSGNSWAVVAGPLAGNAVHGLGTSPAALFAATAAGLFVSRDSGTQWTLRRDDFPYLPVLALAARGAEILAANSRGLFLSGDQGQSWTLTDAHFADLSGLVGTDSLYFASRDGEGIWASPDGKAWAPTNFPPWMRVGSMAAEGREIYARSSTPTFALFRSRDAGATWNRVEPADSVYPVTLALSRGLLYATTRNGLLVSADGGVHWSKTGIGDEPMDRLIASGSILAGSNFRGIFISQNGPWMAMGLGLPDPSIRAIGILGNRLLAGFEQDGIWVSSPLPASLSSLPRRSEAGWTRAKGGISFAYALPEPALVRLTFFTAGGRRLGGLEKSQSGGRQTLQWSDPIPFSGAFYRLEALSLRPPRNRLLIHFGFLSR